MRYLSSLLLAVCVCLATTALQGQAPQIDKIDPPNWWAQFPDPMLLVHGENLNGARFQLAGSGVDIKRTQVSDNGHWAFLWLDASTSAPQTLSITAENAAGQAHAAYVFAAPRDDPHSGFSSADAMYLIMTDRFADGDSANDLPSDDRSAPRGWHGGDLRGIEQHIDYLKQLGVTTVWTTPVASNGAMPESYHGYAATDLYAVDPHFGTLDDYRHLAAALHAHGMKLVIDLVPNHVGVKHPWVNDPPTPNWFHGTLAQHLGVQHDFYQLIDPHAPPEAWRNVTKGWFTDGMPDLNQENPLVAQYLIQNAIWWVETAGLDGIRLDTFPYVDRAFWHDFHATLHSLFPNLTTVGEIYHRDPEVTSYFAGGAAHNGVDTGLDTPFDFPTYFALRDVFAHGKPMTELTDVLRQDELYPHPERLVPFIGNHDTTRFLTDAGGNVADLKLAFGLLFTLRGMPQIYSGDEIGMTGGADPDNRHDFPGGFPGDAHNAFTQAGRTPQEQEIFTWTSGMLALRASHTALKFGMEQNLFADADGFAFVRALDAAGCSQGRKSDEDSARFLIVLNKSDKAKSIDLPMDGTALAGCAQFAAEAPATGVTPAISGGKLHVEEAPASITVYEAR
ncbi:MAG TPA: alpha-amylase family glycosyl hydrolase [Terracidiphilus sp.]|nr:alpha-amylase family glycosyl hydrolase [Terracidiphilus sp.]